MTEQWTDFSIRKIYDVGQNGSGRPLGSKPADLRVLHGTEAGISHTPRLGDPRRGSIKKKKRGKRRNMAQHENHNGEAGGWQAEIGVVWCQLCSTVGVIWGYRLTHRSEEEVNQLSRGVLQCLEIL
jgi:hypothetical protein